MAERSDLYAAAIYELASAEGELGRVEQEIYAIGRSIEDAPSLREALTDPRLPYDRKQSVVDELVGGRASPLTVDLMSLIVARGRAGDMPEIADRLADRVAAAEGKQVAEIRTAIPLDDATMARLAAALTKSTGRPVEVKAIVDPTVVGGVVARVGDTVIDGSVRRRLESLREALKSR